MRLLHVSDWHVGLTTGVFARRRDHEHVFLEIAGIAKDVRPDLILHTGDLFHTHYPAVDDMRFGIDALLELARIAPVLVVRGNHDSDRLFAVFDELLGAASQLRFIPAPALLGDPSIDPVRRYPAADGSRIALVALPFVHANRTLPRVEDPETRTSVFAERVGAYERDLGAALLNGLGGSDVAIFAAHQYVSGALKSGSERPLHVADDYATHATDVPAVSYAAFGHIHRPQSISATSPARYAGSPIPIDYGEEGERKSVVFVEAAPGRAARIEEIALSGGRPLLTLSIAYADLDTIAERVSGTLCRLTVKTDRARSDLASEIADRFPKAEFVEIVEDCSSTRASVVEEGDVSSRATLTELFADYVRELEGTVSSAEELQALFARAVAAVESNESLPPLVVGEFTA